MANMGYCRFQNTLFHLQDCKDKMEEWEWTDESPEEQLSSEEFQALQWLLECCADTLASAKALGMVD